MSERAEFYMMGQPLDGHTLHYTASGLDYVYLLNGFTVENDPDHGRIVTIDAMDDLHRAIGLRIICQPRRMTGQEFRFLRKQMSLKQTDLAERFGVDVQTVANYEKNRKIPPASENLIRVYFLLWLTPPDARCSAAREHLMNTLRKRFEPVSCARAPKECVIDYSDEVTPEQARKIEERLKSEFEGRNWVTVEAES